MAAKFSDGKAMVDYLNSVAAIDPNFMRNMVDTRKRVSQRLVKDTNIQVLASKSFYTTYKAGLVGLMNGFFELYKNSDLMTPRTAYWADWGPIVVITDDTYRSYIKFQYLPDYITEAMVEDVEFNPMEESEPSQLDKAVGVTFD